MIAQGFFQQQTKERIRIIQRFDSFSGFLLFLGSYWYSLQFFITMAGGLERLDKKHTIFGEVAEGFDVLMKLNNAYCDEDNHPIQVIRIRHTDILHDPFPDPAGLHAPDSSPEPPRLPDGRLDDEVKFDPHEGMTEEEIAEAERIHQAEANEEVLVMVSCFFGFCICLLRDLFGCLISWVISKIKKKHRQRMCYLYAN